MGQRARKHECDWTGREADFENNCVSVKEECRPRITRDVHTYRQDRVGSGGKGA